MKIWKYLFPGHIYLNVSLQDKGAVFRFIADSLGKTETVVSPDAILKGLQLREEMMSTGIGGGIGIPHTASSEIDKAVLLLIHLDKPIAYEALDSLPVDIILALIVPENKTSLHLQMLAGISRLCRDPEFLNMIRKADDSQALIEKIREMEEGIEFH